MESRNCNQTAEYELLLFNNNNGSTDWTPVSVEIIDNDGAFILDNDGAQILDNG